MIFSDSPQQRALERMMTAVPRFRPKGGGIIMVGNMDGCTVHVVIHILDYNGIRFEAVIFLYSSAKRGVCPFAGRWHLAQWQEKGKGAR